MFCTHCGHKLMEADLFCSRCGEPTREGYPSPSAATPTRLSRPMDQKKIAGVCAGFARYLGVDVTLVRVIWLAVAIGTGVGFIAYIVAWLLMPRDMPAHVAAYKPAQQPQQAG